MENTKSRFILTDEQTEEFCAAAGLTKQECTHLLGLIQSASRRELLLALAFMEGVRLGTIQASGTAAPDATADAPQED